MTNEIIKEIISGNGNGFNVKEILQAHIQDDNKFKDEIRSEFKWVRTRFEKGTNKIAENRIRIESISKILKYGIAPFSLFILGWLAKIQIIP